MSGHIEHKFEEWFDNTMGFTQEDKVLCFEAYRDAYDQGRRDLIEVMNVVGYRYYVDKMDYWEFVENPVSHRICYPVYAFPEDVA